MASFPHYRQLDSMDCGPTCLKIVAQYYGRNYSLQNLREKCHITREGVSMLGISDAAELIGLRSTGVKITWEQLRNEMTMPCIVHWNQNHFVVVYKIRNGKVYVSDPASGLLKYPAEKFRKSWEQSQNTPLNDPNNPPSLSPHETSSKGIALILEPTPEFYKEKGDEDKRLKFSQLLHYLKPYKRYLVQLGLAMLTASVLSLILPFLTQSVVDKGIGTSDLSFVVMMLIAQVVLVLGQMANNLIRSWLMLHMTTRISISLISNFLAKLMRLPIAFFDSKMVGDIMQRIGDYYRIQSFLTGSHFSMMLGFYPPVDGEVMLGGRKLAQYSASAWRKECGSVMQEGYIFSDTIAGNIGACDERPDMARVRYATSIANIDEYIDGLPLGYNTKIGADGNGLSTGQKQRLLIARAAYKDAKFLFFDEATNSLDVNNEQRTIMERLERLFKNKKDPSWVIRWGVTVVFAIFGGVFLGCYFIKYPDIIISPAQITTYNPPVDLISRSEGLIDTLFVENGKTVESGNIIAVLDNTANWEDIKFVADQLERISADDYAKTIQEQWVGKNYNLGDIQDTFSAFQKSARDYSHYIATEHISQKKELLKEQITKNKEYFTKQQIQYTHVKEDLALQQKSYSRDSILFADKVISKADFEIASQNLISKYNAASGFNASLTSTELQIIQLEQQLVELNIQQENETSEYERSLTQSYQQLTAEIAKWKQFYTITAPTSGTITLGNYWNEHQHVKVGDKLATILPQDKAQIIGRVQIPSAGFGKVEFGQKVNIKLDGYPYMEFGVLEGVISLLSAVPEEMQTSNGTTIVYLAEITFPNGLTTSYNKELPLIQQMDGTAEIITEDMRLISRFFNPIISLFKN